MASIAKAVNQKAATPSFGSIMQAADGLEPAPLAEVPILDRLDILRARTKVIESQNGKKQVGDEGRSVGDYHMQEAYVDQVNSILGENLYTYDDRKDPVKAAQMYDITVKSWLDKEPNLTEEQIYRRHNGGPTGDKKKSTLAHWENYKRENGLE